MESERKKGEYFKVDVQKNCTLHKREFGYQYVFSDWDIHKLFLVMNPTHFRYNKTGYVMFCFVYSLLVHQRLCPTRAKKWPKTI